MNTPADATSDSGSPAIKWPLRTAAILVLAEGVVLTGYLVWVAFSAVVRQPPDRPGLAFATMGLLLVVGLALVFAGARLARGNGRVRALAIVGQLLIGVIGYDYLARGMSAGMAGFVIAAVTIVLLLVPSSTAVLTHRGTEDDQKA